MSAIAQDAPAWLDQFETALRKRNRSEFRALFTEGAAWRDIVSFTWNLRQFHNRDAIEDYLFTVIEDIDPSDFKIDVDYPEDPIFQLAAEPVEIYEVNFVFETAAGRGDGLVHLVPDADSASGWIATHLFTRLKQIKGHEPQWPQFGRYSQDELEHERATLEENRKFIDRDPEVLVVGGGHNGVFMGAELNRLGIDNLVIDKFPRPGDSWRQRYSSLVLHQPHGMMHFLHLPFPVSFPDYISKDRLADWYMAYVDALDVNLWNSTEFLGGSYDESAGRWDVQLRLEDGTIRTMRPRDLVLATGGSGTPRVPDIAGLSDFAGEVIHSSKFRAGEDYEGKRVMVVGAATSAHDIAFDVVRKGGVADLYQRNPIFVTDLSSANLNYGAFNTRDVATEVLDKRWMSTQIKPIMLENFKIVTKIGNEQDKELHEKLEAAGFRLAKEEHGWFARYFEIAGGYYLNVGASEAIIDGRIGMRQFSDVDRIEARGVRLNSGEVIEYDVIVLATGFENQRVILERFFGPEVADKIGPVGGFDEQGEPERNGYRPITTQPHLYINGGGISPGRWYTPPVGLLILADREGIIPESFTAVDHPSRSPYGELLAT